MFKFNFDVDDDGDQTMGNLGDNCTKQNNGSASPQDVVPDAFSELSLADAVCPNTACFPSA
jgi:hypothetical protein